MSVSPCFFSSARTLKDRSELRSSLGAYLQFTDAEDFLLALIKSLPDDPVLNLAVFPASLCISLLMGFINRDYRPSHALK